MTYKLNPELSKITSPVVLIDGDCRMEFQNGKALTEAVFEKRYLIKSLTAVENKVEIVVEEQNAPQQNWAGEEAVSFF